MTITFDQLLAQSNLPRLEARLLLQYASNLNHANIIANGLDWVSVSTKKRFDRLVRLRKIGQPIAYLVKQREFYGRVFLMNDSVLIPRPDTELLVDTALSLEKNTQQKTLLDLGTGSGIIAITLALENKDWHVVATDISANAIALAQKNAQLLSAKVEFFQGNWFNCIQLMKLKFNMIVANPPYIAMDDPHLKIGDLRFEPLEALTDYEDGFAHFKTIVAGAKNYLLPSGYLVLEHGATQGKEVRTILKKAGFAPIHTRKDLSNQERVSIGQFL